MFASMHNLVRGRGLLAVFEVTLRCNSACSRVTSSLIRHPPRAARTARQLV